VVHTFPEGFIPIGDAFAQALEATEDCAPLLRSIDEAKSNDERFVLFDKYDAVKRRVEKRMRSAIADGHLRPFMRGQNGQIEQMVDRKGFLVDRKGFPRESFGVPGIENVPHHLTNPGPDTDGRPIFLRSSDFESWLKIYRLKRNTRAGAPIKYDWPDAKNFAMDQLNKEGEFREWDDGWKTRADLERRVLTYMEKATGECNGPAPSTLRAKVAQWVAEWQTNANK
jgi:hypothetical protein